MRSTALDGMRGYAALAVIVYHAVLWWFSARGEALIVTSIFDIDGWDARIAKAIITVFDGQTAVMVFFVISGAVLFQSLKRQKYGVLRRSLRFVASRVLRIYPALIICLLSYWGITSTLTALWPSTFSPPILSDVLLNAALIDTSVHGASWTLKAEMAAIPFILCVFLLFRTLGMAALALVACFALLTFNPAGALGPFYLAGLWVMYFTAGFIAAEIAESRLVHDLTRNGRWIVLLLCVLTIRGLYPAGIFSVTIVQCSCICVLVAHAMSRSPSALKQFAERPTSRFLGRISYSLYLWNVPVMLLCIRLMPQGWSIANPVSAGVALFVVVTIITIPIAWVSAAKLENFRLPSPNHRRDDLATP